MSETEKLLLTALLELEAAARDRRQLPPPLQPLFERIDRLAASLPPETDPELRHFLQRKSYTKAREWLQGLGPARGQCGG